MRDQKEVVSEKPGDVVFKAHSPTSWTWGLYMAGKADGLEPRPPTSTAALFTTNLSPHPTVASPSDSNTPVTHVNGIYVS